MQLPVFNVPQTIIARAELIRSMKQQTKVYLANVTMGIPRRLVRQVFLIALPTQSQFVGTMVMAVLIRQLVHTAEH